MWFQDSKGFLFCAYFQYKFLATPIKSMSIRKSVIQHFAFAFSFIHSPHARHTHTDNKNRVTDLKEFTVQWEMEDMGLRTKVFTKGEK